MTIDLAPIVDAITSRIAAIDSQLVELDSTRHVLSVDRDRLIGALRALEVENAGVATPNPIGTVPVSASRSEPATPANPAPPAKAAAKPALSSKPSGRKPAHDLGVVARLARAAAAQGESPRRRLAAELGVQPVYAGQLMKAARNAGHDVPYERQPKSTGAPRPAAPADTGAAAVDLPDATAAPDPPLTTRAADAGSAYRPKHGDKVIRCEIDDCDHIEFAHERSAMIRHYTSKHGRKPTQGELLPSTYGEAA